MTNDKAVKLLHRIADSQFDGIHGDERREALEMAVRALFSQQIVNDSQGLVNDCISRKMAIDAFEPEHDTDWYTPQIIEVLEALPSAQPETHDKRTETHECDLINRQQAIDAVVSAMIDGADAELVEGVMELLPSAQPEPCDDLRADVYYLAEKIGIHRLYALVVELRGEPEPCEDAVSREAVSEWLKQYGQDVLHGKYKFSLMYIWKNLMGLPSAQPQRKKGKWIKLDMHAHIADHKCTACGQECYVPTCMGEPMYTYCPNCGARMEGEANE